MRILFIILYILSGALSYGQNCDTLYSHENYIERKVHVVYRNCYYLNLDTVYAVVQKINHNPVYQERYRFQSDCYSLYHSETGSLIKEFWKVGDTSFANTYFSSGRLKEFYRNIKTKTPYFNHTIIKRYYESGQIRSSEEYKSTERTSHTTFYETGEIMSKGFFFNFGFHHFGDYTEYFPNSQISSIRTYSLPDTTTMQYQQSNLLNEVFFDPEGNKVSYDMNEYQEYYISIYPPAENSDISMIGDSMYTYDQFDSQEYYSGGMKSLKKAINDRLKNRLPECNTGVIRLSLIVTKKGLIRIEEVQTSDEKLKSIIENILHEIQHWPPAHKDGEKVNTYIYIPLIIR